jgi:thiamine biosynthesis lipoprotein ApbE
MRYLITGEWNRQHVMRVIMIFFVVYVVFFWLTSALLYFYHMDLTPASVIKYYRGSEEEFLPAKSYLGLLEVSHSHLFAMGILLVTLTHLLLFVPGTDGKKVFIAVLVLSGGLADIIAGWLVLYVHPLFAYFKIAAFLTLQSGILFLLFQILSALRSKQKLSYRSEKKARLLKRIKRRKGKRGITLFNLLLHGMILYKSGLPAYAENGQIYKEARLAMGTVLTVSLCDVTQKEALDHFNAIFKEMTLIESLISEWQPTSEVSKLIMHASRKDPVTVAPLTYDFLRFAKEMSVVTGGAIDITVGTITKKEAIGVAPHHLSLIGNRSITLGENLTVKLASGVKLDTGAVGKGYALDKVKELLQKRGATCALLDFGMSSFLALDAPKGVEGWKLKLSTSSGSKSVMLRQQAASTSATLVIKNTTKKEPHIINPLTGTFVKKDKVVTIIAPTAGYADALSTWAIIAGASEVESKVERKDVLLF